MEWDDTDRSLQNDGLASRAKEVEMSVDSGGSLPVPSISNMRLPEVLKLAREADDSLCSCRAGPSFQNSLNVSDEVPGKLPGTATDPDSLRCEAPAAADSILGS